MESKKMTSIPITPSPNSESGSLLLDIPLNVITIPKWLRDHANKDGYKTKDEYHVTIIGLDLAQIIQSADKESLVDSLIRNTRWTVEILNRYIELAKDDDNGIHRQSIICTVDVPQMANFYKELDKILELETKMPPAHVTLYTKNYDRGIGLYNYDDLLRFKVRDLSESS